MITPLSKGVPLVIQRKLKRARIEAERVEVKSAVFKRDGGLCRCCGGHATELHELRFRSLGGQRSTENSIAVCDFRGANCHRMIQTHVIDVEKLTEAGADGRLRFTLSATGRTWEG